MLARDAEVRSDTPTGYPVVKRGGGNCVRPNSRCESSNQSSPYRLVACAHLACCCRFATASLVSRPNVQSARDAIFGAIHCLEALLDQLDRRALVGEEVPAVRLAVRLVQSDQVGVVAGWQWPGRCLRRIGS